MQATSEAGERQAGRGGGGPPDMVRAVALVTGVTGLVHLAAAVAHRDHTTLLGMFLVAAALQVLGAVALVSRPRVPALLVLTAVVNGAFVAFYALTRITGLSDIEGLEQAQPVAYGDLAATLLEGVAVLGALAMLAPAALPFAQRPRLARSAPVALVTLALVLGGPAVVASAEHEGSHRGHQHGDVHARGPGGHAGGHHDRDHHRLCADENRQFTGLAFEGQCFSGTLLEVPPMMHVGIVDTPCGRFAGVDELGLSCGHEH